MRHRFEDIAVNSIAKRKPTDRDMESYIGLEHLDTGDLRVTRFGSKVPIKGEKLLMKKGDVLFGRRNTYLKRAAIAPHDGLFSAHGMVLRPKEEVVAGEFFPFFISSDYFFNAAIRISVGSISPTVNWGTLKELEFELPSLDKQRQLADVLWAVIETRNAYKKLLTLTDELVKSQFVEMFGDPVRNPMGWKTRRLESFGKVGSSKRVFTTEFVESGVPFYRGTEIASLSMGEYPAPKYYISEAHYEELKNATGVPAVGDLLLPSICPDGEVWRVDNDSPFYFKDGRVLWVHVEDREVDSGYLCFALHDKLIRDFTKVASGTTFAEMKIITLKRLELFIPPLALQNHFADFVRQADKSKFELQRTLNELDAMYKALLKENLGEGS
jgi:type I restriction enzyme S subunit